MLGPDDRALARRDPAIPALSLCLDPQALADHVAGAAGAAGDWAPVLGVTVDYLRYKPATSIVAGLVLHTAAGPRHAFAKAGAPGLVDKLGKTTSYALGDPHGFAPSLDEDLGLVIGPASADRHLPGLASLLDEPAALLPGRRGVDRVQILRYKPERRVVARLTGTDGPVSVAKVQDPDRVAALLVTSRAMASAGLPVPRVVGRSHWLGIILTEHVKGAVPDDGTTDDDLLTVAGELLARWHAVPPWHGIDLPDHAANAANGARGEAGTAGLVDAVSALVPSAHGLARATVDRALAAVADLPEGGPPVVVHGDFSVDQLLRRRGRVTVLDLDRARADRPGVDVASWFAAEVLARRCPTGSDPRQVLAPMLDAYEKEAGLDLRPGLAALSSLALLARAVEPFRLRAPDWAARTEELVQAAADLAAGTP